jgi:hypothetical protein
MIVIKDVNEIPYAIPDKNINDDELPISVVVIPREAIKIGTVHRNDMLTIYKCVFITFFTIPAVLVLISFFTRMP